MTDEQDTHQRSVQHARYQSRRQRMTEDTLRLERERQRSRYNSLTDAQRETRREQQRARYRARSMHMSEEELSTERARRRARYHAQRSLPTSMDLTADCQDLHNRAPVTSSAVASHTFCSSPPSLNNSFTSISSEGTTSIVPPTCTTTASIELTMVVAELIVIHNGVNTG